MARPTSTGICLLCEKRYSRAGMGRHLRACRGQAGVPEMVGSNKPGQQAIRNFHVAVEDRHDPRYWMHLEMPQELELKNLDGFLRNIWLECCGHLSAFHISGVMYQSGDKDWFNDFGGPTAEDMAFAADRVLSRGQRFTYDYDFGSTTELSLRVISELAPRLRNGIQLLAINDPPRLACHACRNAAADVICTECATQAYPNLNPGYLCDDCSTRHGCDDMMYLPVVNSPRVGMCGYVG